MTTTPQCNGDDPTVNCTDLDIRFNNNLCTSQSSAGIIQACCEYCYSKTKSTTKRKSVLAVLIIIAK